MEALDTQEQIEAFIKLIDNIRHECLSRSGMVGIDHTRRVGSNFNVVFLTTFEEAISNLGGEGLLGDKFREKVVNRFMTYQHEMIVQRRHFNWNWN